MVGELEKVKVYVYSSRISTLSFLDKEGAQHACAQAGSKAFEGLKHLPGPTDNGYLSESERNAIIVVEDFCNKKGFECEVVDLARIGFLARIRLRLNGLSRLPAISFRERVACGVPNERTLEELLEA